MCSHQIDPNTMRLRSRIILFFVNQLHKRFGLCLVDCELTNRQHVAGIDPLAAAPFLTRAGRTDLELSWINHSAASVQGPQPPPRQMTRYCVAGALPTSALLPATRFGLRTIHIFFCFLVLAVPDLRAARIATTTSCPACTPPAAVYPTPSLASFAPLLGHGLFALMIFWAVSLIAGAPSQRIPLKSGTGRNKITFPTHSTCMNLQIFALYPAARPRGARACPCSSKIPARSRTIADGTMRLRRAPMRLEP